MRAAACVVIFVACSYGDPDLDATQFRCDNGKACPSGQVCAGTVCVAATHDGVTCGAARDCTPDERCCLDSSNPADCFPALEECLGTAAACDEKSDCRPGAVCCVLGNELTCTDAFACSTVACRIDDDCPSTARNCCVDIDTPWKRCQLDPC